ncbi:hypothetical protein LEMLEM_LOCUS27504 [Lemmus lemmus]
MDRRFCGCVGDPVPPSVVQLLMTNWTALGTSIPALHHLSGTQYLHWPPGGGAGRAELS